MLRPHLLRLLRNRLRLGMLRLQSMLLLRQPCVGGIQVRFSRSQGPATHDMCTNCSTLKTLLTCSKQRCGHCAGSSLLGGLHVLFHGASLGSSSLCLSAQLRLQGAPVGVQHSQQAPQLRHLQLKALQRGRVENTG